MPNYIRVINRPYWSSEEEINNGIDIQKLEARTITQDLKNGDIVELRNGERCVYIEKNAEWHAYDSGIYKKIISLRNGVDIRLSRYDDDLLFNNRASCEFDIIKILDMSKFYKNPKWTLERKQRKQEEMTLEEICKELGRDIKIVKEKSND